MAINYLNRKDSIENTLIANNIILEEIEGYGESIGKMAMNVGKGAFNATLGLAKAGGGAVYDKVTPESAKFHIERIKTIFNKMIRAIIKMLENLYNAVLGAEIRLERTSNDLSKALTNRRASGKYPKYMEIVDESTLEAIGLTLEKDNSRAVLTKNFLTKIKDEGSIIEGVSFDDKKSLQNSMEELMGRLTGTKPPYDNITPDIMRDAIRNNLYVFQNVNTKIKEKKKKFNPLTWNKETAIDEVKKHLRQYPGNEAMAVLENDTVKLRELIKPFVELKVIDFLRSEKEKIGKIEDSIDRLFEEQRKEMQKEADTKRSVDEYNRKQQSSQDKEVKSDNGVPDEKESTPEEIPSAQSYYEEINGEAFGEGIFYTKKGNMDTKSLETQNAGALSKENELLKILLVEYSKVLNDTIGNISKFYKDIIFVSRKVLNDIYKITE